MTDERVVTERERPLRIGTDVLPWGEIAAVGVAGGERYYWLVHPGSGSVAMLPATEVERQYRSRPTEEVEDDGQEAE